MITYLVVKYLHFVGIFLIVATLSAEWALLQKQLSRRQVVTLSKIDALYGFAAVLVLAMGLTLWFGVGKPAAFFSQNWIFHLKVGLYVVVGLLSIWPTIFFIKNRKGHPDDLLTIPASIRWCVAVEVLLLFVIPLLAVLMANGVGAF